MRLLVLGGTRFLGRHLVEAALREGDAVTIFHRGRTNPDLFAGQVERISGDRDGDLDVLASGEWDAVVDTCGYVPRVVAASAAALSSRCGHYTFVSSESVYGDVGEPGIDESAPVDELVDPATEVVDNETYGGLKALCEAAAEAAMPGRVLNVRPGLIVGPWTRPTASRTGRGGSPPAATSWRPAGRSGRCSSSTGATWPAGCWPPPVAASRAPTTPPGRPSAIGMGVSSTPACGCRDRAPGRCGSTRPR